MSDYVAVSMMFEGDIDFELVFFLPGDEWDYSKRRMLADEEEQFPLFIELGGHEVGNFESAQELFDVANLEVTRLTEAEYNTFIKVFTDFRAGPRDISIPYLEV